MRPTAGTQNLGFSLLVTACAAVFLVWSAPIAVLLHTRWLRAGFEHGYPIAILSLILVVLAVRQHGVRIGRMRAGGVAALLILVVAASLGQAATISILPALILPLCVIALLWTFGVRGGSRYLWPSILFIYFAIPFWQVFDVLSIPVFSLNEVLRVVTTKVASGLVRVAGIPALIDGDFIHIPAGVFEIADGCSGRGYFIVALELSLFYGLAFLRSWISRLKLVAVAAVCALIGNWLRVFMLILIGDWTDMSSGLIEDHEAFGWWIFVAVLIPLFWYGRLLEHSDFASSLPDTVHRTSASTLKSSSVIVAMSAVVFVLGIVVTSRINAAYSSPVSAEPIVLPEIGGWKTVGRWTGDTVPEYRNTAAEIAVQLRNGDLRAAVYLADYPVQRQGSEVVYFANKPFGLSAAAHVTRARRIEAESGTVFWFQESTVTDSTGKRLVWVGSVVAGNSPASVAHAKIQQIKGAIAGRVDAQVAVFSADCVEAECTAAVATLTQLSQVAASSFFAAAAAATMPLEP
jgi:exosortase